MKNGLLITVAFRKRDTGYKIWWFQTTDADGARTAAQLLVDTQPFRNCYAVVTDWEGEIIGEFRPSDLREEPRRQPVYAQPAPQPVYAHYPQPQALPQYQQPQYAPQPYPQPQYPQPQYPQQYAQYPQGYPQQPQYRQPAPPPPQYQPQPRALPPRTQRPAYNGTGQALIIDAEIE